MSEHTSAGVASRAGEILTTYRDHVFGAVKPYYKDPIVVSEAEGVRVTDVDGREYLDLFAGILTTSVGHCHPNVVERVTEQMARLGHTSTLYVNEPHAEAARLLAGISPGSLSRTFFTNSGTEAVETAVMVACMYTGRSEVVALRHAYSGRSFLTTNITAHASWRSLPASLPGISHAMSPNPYRAPIAWTDPEELTDFYIRDLEEVIATCTSGRPAAFIAETIQGVGGYIVPPTGYFQRAAELIRSVGGLLIIDEVQAGFGRTGDHWFGIEHWGVEPDIMVMAKGIANGFPVGATITRPEIADAWTKLTISTFGGNAVCMAAACATMGVMKAEDTPARSAARGAQLRSGLDELQDRYAWIGDVRGMGLMLGMELVEDRKTKEPSPKLAVALLEAAREEGLLIGRGGLNGQVVRIGPSMLISAAEVAEGIERLSRACARVDAMR